MVNIIEAYDITTTSRSGFLPTIRMTLNDPTHLKVCFRSHGSDGTPVVAYVASWPRVIEWTWDLAVGDNNVANDLTVSAKKASVFQGHLQCVSV